MIGELRKMLVGYATCSAFMRKRLPIKNMQAFKPGTIKLQAPQTGLFFSIKVKEYLLKNIIIVM
jgi:hypothetical protein